VGPRGFEVFCMAPAGEDAAMTRGWRVFTRPSIISGKPVTADTLVTAKPASASALAVPPVETSSNVRRASSAPSSARPVLSETLSSARGMGTQNAFLAQLILG
jgi:hypothetical protein